MDMEDVVLDVATVGTGGRGVEGGMCFVTGGCAGFGMGFGWGFASGFNDELRL